MLAAPTSIASNIVFVPGTGNGGIGPSPLLLSRAKAALDAHKNRVRNRDLIAIADFSKASRDPRFYLVDLRGGQPSSFLVAHGKGSDPGHSGFVQNFSNLHGSEATSSGSYLVGETYFGQYGESRRLAGLDPPKRPGREPRHSNSPRLVCQSDDDCRTGQDRSKPRMLRILAKRHRPDFATRRARNIALR